MPSLVHWRTIRWTYNNESRYVRSLNFTVPSETTRVEIVATITGHGFQQDDANCAEFCDHQHHYYMDSHHTYEWHPIVYSSTGCENEVNNGVVANQFGSWPFGRAGGALVKMSNNGVSISLLGLT